MREVKKLFLREPITDKPSFEPREIVHFTCECQPSEHPPGFESQAPYCSCTVFGSRKMDEESNAVSVIPDSASNAQLHSALFIACLLSISLFTFWWFCSFLYFVWYGDDFILRVLHWLFCELTVVDKHEIVIFVGARCILRCKWARCIL